MDLGVKASPVFAALRNQSNDVVESVLHDKGNVFWVNYFETRNTIPGEILPPTPSFADEDKL
jgi:hypothetical protein